MQVNSIKRRDNFFILTGGPGSGKSSIIQALREQGYLCMDEVGRQIIQEQLSIGGNALHTADNVKFRDLMLTRSMGDYLRVNESQKPIFFDRGIPDLIGYSHLIGVVVPDEYEKAVERYRYNRVVFVAPPWEEIYVQDAERKQDFQEAIDTYHRIVEGYQACGYETVELPKTDVLNRILFILNRVSQKSGVSNGESIPNSPYTIVKDMENIFEIIDSQLYAFNKKCVAATQSPESVDIRYVVKENNEVIAGICANVYTWKIMYLELLFVNEAHRNNNLATALLRKVEAQATSMGVTLVHTDTYDFQAKDFYLKQGYEIFGVLEGCPPGHSRYYLKKKLA